MAGFEIVAEGLGFPEGPVVMDDGSVIVVEVAAGRVTRCWNGRTEVVSRPGGGPNGAAIGPDGALYLCNNGGEAHLGQPAEDGRVERIDLASGRVERVYDACDCEKLSAPNDLMFDVDGNMWFTDLGRIGADGKAFGGLYCARADGGAVTRVKGRALSYNGVGVSPDMKSVYVADTYSARVWAFERRAEAQEPRLLATVPGPVMLDSLAMSAAGNVCVATLLQGAISTVTPQGAVTTTPCEDRLVTNIAFGGPDMRDAWLTFSQRGALAKTRWAEPGMRLVYNA
jgi:gluconolactonase